MIQAADLTKHYGSTLALDHLNLDVPDVAVFGLLGPNGSGKTTFIKLLLAFILPGAGRVGLGVPAVSPQGPFMGGVSLTMWPLLLAASLVLLCLAALLLWRSRRGRQQSGLPQGRLVYADTGRWSEVAKPYFSARYRLTGKPDYLVETEEGLVPVEVKRTAAPAGGRAYESHILQLAAYCLLVEDAHGQPPPHGLIHYANATIQIEYTEELRQRLLAVMEAMRASRHQLDVRRSHDEPARCDACGVRHACGRDAVPS